MPTLLSSVARRMAPLALALFMTTPFLAAAETVKLADGRTFRVESEWGGPPQASADGYRIDSMRLAVITLRNPIRFELCWSFKLTFKTGAKAIDRITIKAVTDAAAAQPVLDLKPFDPKLLVTYRPGISAVEGTVYPRGAHPKVWEGWDTQDPFWTRFDFEILDKDPAVPPVLLSQWVKIPKWRKARILELQAGFEKEALKHRQAHHLTLPDGRAFEVFTWDGEVEIKHGRPLLLWLGPEVYPAKEPGRKAELAWNLSGVGTNPEELQVTLWNALEPGQRQTFTFKGRTLSTTRLFPQELCPALWTWLEQPGDTWVPFGLSVATAGKPTVEWIQWARVSEGAKEKLRRDPSR